MLSLTMVRAEVGVAPAVPTNACRTANAHLPFPCGFIPYTVPHPQVGDPPSTVTPNRSPRESNDTAAIGLIPCAAFGPKSCNTCWSMAPPESLVNSNSVPQPAPLQLPTVPPDWVAA